MDRYVGLGAHARTRTLAVLSRSGKRLKSLVVEKQEEYSLDDSFLRR